MNIQEKAQKTFGTIVEGAVQNFNVVKEQVSNAAVEVSAAAKEELDNQKSLFNTYKERINSLRAKGFNTNEILGDVKAEATFFGNEIAQTFNRNVETLVSIVSPKLTVLADTAKAATDKVVNEFFKSVQEEEIKEEAVEA